MDNANKCDGGWWTQNPICEMTTELVHFINGPLDCSEFEMTVYGESQSVVMSTPNGHYRYKIQRNGDRVTAHYAGQSPTT